MTRKFLWGRLFFTQRAKTFERTRREREKHSDKFKENHIKTENKIYAKVGGKKGSRIVHISNLPPPLLLQPPSSVPPPPFFDEDNVGGPARVIAGGGRGTPAPALPTAAGAAPASATEAASLLLWLPGTVRMLSRLSRIRSSISLRFLARWRFLYATCWTKKFKYSLFIISIFFGK